MNFYKELSSVYDIVFPRVEETVEFLCKDLKANAEVLDLACGTGTYSFALAERGHKVTALDLDEDMVKLAIEKKGNLDVEFYVEDMTKIKEVFENKRYDLIFCIGNSLVHLGRREAIASLIKDMSCMLNDGGTIILQIINYDRILMNNVTSLPIIYRKEQGIKFTRNYRYSLEEGTIYFETELSISKEDKEEKYVNSVKLLPILSAELLDMIEKSRFSIIELNGEFSGKEYTDESYAFIIKGIK
jgi:glycine/sarcosine N-methyltransferase